MPRLMVLGHAVIDHVFALAEAPVAAEKYRAVGYRAVGGGMAANAAVAIRRLGGEVSFCGRVGDDAVGTAIRDGLVAEGIDTTYLTTRPGRISPLSGVMVDPTGQRTLANYTDPQLFEGIDGLPGRLDDDIQVVLTDYRWNAGAVHLLALAKDTGRISILDFDRNAPKDLTLLACATHIVFGEAGLKALTGRRKLERALRAARKWTDAWLGVTAGSRGVLWLEGQDIHEMPGFEVDSVDTLGAGDVFHGAFALALAEGKRESEAIWFAQAAAALKTTRFGGREGSPTRAEVTAFLADRPAPEVSVVPPLRRRMRRAFTRG